MATGANFVLLNHGSMTVCVVWL